MKPDGGSGGAAAPDPAAATVLRNENFLKGWYSTDRLNSAFCSTPAMPRGFSGVLPESGQPSPERAALPGTPLSPAPAPAAPQADPLSNSFLLRDINVLLGRLEERLEQRLGGFDTLLHRVEQQQQEVMHHLRHGVGLPFVSEGGGASVHHGASDALQHQASQASGVAATRVRGIGQSVLAETAEDRELGKNPTVATKPSGRSPAAFVSTDAELYIDGEDSWRLRLRMFELFVKGTKFDYFFGSVIVLNAIFLGIQIDIKARDMHTMKAFDEPQYFKIIETVFACVFIVELILRISAWRVRYFFSLWNWFDMLVVAAATIEEAVKYGFGGDTVAGKLSVLKLMRIVKLARTLRVIRVIRTFRELRIVVMAIFYCLRALLSTLSLLFVMFYVFAILILVELTSQSDPYSEATTLGLARRELYPNMPVVLVTLFKSITGGLQWDLASQALEDVLPYMAVVWIFFIGFTVFAITNVVTGIFVQQAERVGMDDERNVLMEEMDLRQVVIANLRTLFFKADVDGTGMLTRRCLEECLGGQQARRFIRKFDIDGRDILAFYDLVCDANHCLPLADVDTFLNGIFRLRGPAKNIDLVALTFQHHAFLREHRYDSDKIRTIARALGRRH